MSVKKTSNQPVTNETRLENLLFAELTVGGDVLDRALFYSLSKGLDDEQLSALKERVRERVEGFYAGVRKEHIALGGNLQEGEPEKTSRFIDRSLRSWFRPWTRLAGSIESTIDWNRYERGVEVNEKLLKSIFEAYSKEEAYKPYLEKEFKGFVSNKCFENGLDYLKMPERLRSPELDKKWRKEYPYFLESMEWDIMGMAYKMGTKRDMVLKEEEAFENGYIGGKVSWSSFLEIPNGPVFGGGRAAGKVTGVGQIDYKDCTNCFVVFNGNERAVNIYELSRVQRSSVLERVFSMNKYAEKKVEKANKAPKRKSGVKI